MRIGRLEIRWLPARTYIKPDGINRTLSFAVPDREPWWLGVHQTIDEAEAETIVAARKNILQPYGCIAAVASGEGIDLVRQKLIDKRNIALKEGRDAIHKIGSQQISRP